MNIPAMVGLALLIALEKQWRHGEVVAMVAGAVLVAFALAVAYDADLAPGLVSPDEPMEEMDMG